MVDPKITLILAISEFKLNLANLAIKKFISLVNFGKIQIGIAISGMNFRSFVYDFEKIRGINF